MGILHLLSAARTIRRHPVRTGIYVWLAGLRR